MVRIKNDLHFTEEVE